MLPPPPSTTTKTPLLDSQDAASYTQQHAPTTTSTMPANSSRPKQRWVQAARHIRDKSPKPSNRWNELLTTFRSSQRSTCIMRPPANPDKPISSFQLSDIDVFLGRSKPPAIEYIVVEVLVHKCPLHPSHLGRWAHSAVRYTMPNGDQKLVNICRPEEGHQLIEFYDDPEDYLLGVQGKGGIFSRDICSIRIEDVHPDSMRALDHHFQAISHRFRADGKGCSFEITGGFWENLVREMFHLPSKPSGNCARWVSKGLVYANVLKRQSMFPKAIWVEMLENQSAANAANVNVVYYRRIKGKAKEKPHLQTGFSFTSVKACLFFPTDLFQSWLYWDMAKFANVIVDNSDDVSTDQQAAQLQLELVGGEGCRTPRAVIYCVRFSHAFLVFALALGYVFYCPGGYPPQEHGIPFAYEVCPTTWPGTTGYRITLSIVAIAILEFWWY
ncbi:hypothetical protein H257_10547 [Aphanomyces astaci]|uniref:Uncharacterized protein n=1 Tax=Aphanomyces astaci TaxID=112090 RepID=W4G778_APHAT|nr:hypothetical protein H257_10547 [Aphanomyces astaci]ETV74924.1 hypothetical protein H257_10547 [Aphanomyces astaci]|eukprot:XP_009835428.1 hypothetical protein H257_10547 [Aphanomyces astaci]